ncbi:hypothetical protein JL722_12459 [Aureococcus anophagefferens]|nr:hypothetical protein JL722_12459 [Aureococcus anophagefferens]
MKNISLESSADPEARARRFPEPAGAPHALVSPESSARRINNETPAADEGERAAAAAAEETAGPDAGAAPREFSDGAPSGSPSPEEPGTPGGPTPRTTRWPRRPRPWTSAAAPTRPAAPRPAATRSTATTPTASARRRRRWAPAASPTSRTGGPAGPGHARREPRPEQLETVHCPQARGRLIGKQGDTIKDLQRRSGARIQIDQNFPEGTPRVVTVEGSAQCVALGVQLVRSLIGNSPAVGNGNPGKMTTFECPKALVGRVIGKGGETINELQRRSGARIQIEQRVPERAPCIIEARRGVCGCPGQRRRRRGAAPHARRHGGKRLEPFAGGVAYYGPGAPPGAGYGIPPYLVPQTGGVDFAGGLAQYSRAARLENEKLATKARLRGVPRAAARADARRPAGRRPRAERRRALPAARRLRRAALRLRLRRRRAACAPYYGGGLVPGAYGGPPPPPPAQAVTPDGWTSHVDGQGRQYWHHATSGQSSRDAPPGQSP